MKVLEEGALSVFVLFAIVFVIAGVFISCVAFYALIKANMFLELALIVSLITYGLRKN